MSEFIDLKSVLNAATDKVDQRKLEQLEQKLEAALGCSLSSQIVDDPIIIRRRLAERLRSEGVSQGVVHSFEQLFMGIIRRAAVKGLLPAPPEGPWTRAWQSVLDLGAEVQRAKAPLRSLAGWATVRDLDPTDLKADHLRTWAQDALIDRKVLLIVERVLAQWSPIPTFAVLASDQLLSSRLQKKALRGTVQADRNSR